MDLRLNLDFLNDNKLSNAKNLGEKSSDEDDNDDSETDENPFSTDRNISTVKVNKPRKPIEQILNEPSQSKSDVDAENGKPKILYIYRIIYLLNLFMDLASHLSTSQINIKIIL